MIQTKKKSPRRASTLLPHSDEDSIQSACVFWFGMQFPRYRRLIHHSPNEDAYKHAQRANAMGMQKGFPDIFIAVPRGAYHGLFVEMKTPKGKVSPEQKEMLSLLASQGYLAVIARGTASFIKVVNEYMNLQEGQTYGA